MLVYSLLLSVMTTFRNSIQDGTKLLSMSKIRSDDILKSLYKLRIRESDQLKTVFELYDMEIHQKISVPNYQMLKTVRNFDYATLTPDMRKLSQEQWSGIEMDCPTLKEEKVSVTSGTKKKKTSVRKETASVSATRPKIVRKNQSTLPPHLLSQPHHEVEVRRGREVSEAKVTMGPFFDNRADII